jgi:LysR family transcriptional regulator, glycine cleavage system transcriptional activator
MPRKLPPFAALRAFDAAARYCNLRLASEELFLSVSAVSHQVKALEQFLGVQLFNRTHSSLELTSAGERYMKDVAAALDMIASATARVEAARNLTSVAIHMFPSLAVLWFMPKLSMWYERAPHTDVTVVTSVETVNFRSGSVDVAIRYEEKASLSATALTLFDEHIYPVCSPQYALDNAIQDPPSALDNVTLIHCQTAPGEWEEWFQSTAGIAIPPRRALNVDNRALALQAAESGLGVAMGRTPFAQRALRDGRLCRLSEDSLASGFNYTLGLSDSAARNPTIQDFVRWLVETAQECVD